MTWALSLNLTLVQDRSFKTNQKFLLSPNNKYGYYVTKHLRGEGVATTNWNIAHKHLDLALKKKVLNSVKRHDVTVLYELVTVIYDSITVTLRMCHGSLHIMKRILKALQQVLCCSRLFLVYVLEVQVCCIKLITFSVHNHEGWVKL